MEKMGGISLWGSWGICMAEHLAVDTKGLKRPNKSTSGLVNLCLAQTQFKNYYRYSCVHFQLCEPLSSSNY
jgi:hypothetical protein